MTSLRDELVGHGTLLILALLGLAIYSTTYGLVYSMSSTTVVAVIEMYMIYAHLAVAGACGALQLVVPVLLHQTTPVPHLAATQSALFLGVALSVTLLASACMGSATGHECALYFGAAVLPRLAAAGAATWAWIVYLASLGCQAQIEGLGGLTAAAAMSWVPWLVASTAAATCGDPWRVLVCGGVSVALSANATASTVSADCSNLDLGLWLSALGLLLGEIASWLPYGGARLVGAILSTIAVLTAWLAQPSDVAVPVPVAYHSCLLILTLAAVVYEGWLLLRAVRTHHHPHHRGGKRKHDSDVEAPLLPVTASTDAPWLALAARKAQ